MKFYLSISLKFQLQKVKEDCLGSGLIFTSPQKYNNSLIFIAKKYLNIYNFQKVCQKTKCRIKDIAN